jgi:glycosyltransferase involved in cell wall biosynthesis
MPRPGEPRTIVYHHRTQARDGQRVHIREIQDALRAGGHRVIEVAPVSAAERAGSKADGRRGRMIGQLAGAMPGAIKETLAWAYNAYAIVRLSAAVRRERADFIYERHALNTVAGACVARWLGVPLILEVNSPVTAEQHALGRVRFVRIARALERYALRGAARVLVVSDVLQRIVEDDYGVPPERVRVVRNGIDPGRFSRAARQRDKVRAALGAGDRLVIGAAAFFLEWHGIDRLLRWLAARPELHDRVRVVLVGKGPALPALRQQAAATGIAHCMHFTGDVDHHDVPDLMAAIDVAVMGRATAYASPLKLFEYMASGCAIVAPRQQNLAEILTDGGDALLFDPDDDGSFDAAMNRVVADGALRRALGLRARRAIAERRYTWSDNASRIIAAYDSVAALPPRLVLSHDEAAMP